MAGGVHRRQGPAGATGLRIEDTQTSPPPPSRRPAAPGTGSRWPAARGNIVRVETVIGAQSYVTEYAHDLADRMVQMTYPSGRIVDYGRDAIGRVDLVTTRANALATPVALASGATYEPFGGIDALAYGNGVTLALGHDLNGRMVAMDAFNGGTAGR